MSRDTDEIVHELEPILALLGGIRTNLDTIMLDVTDIKARVTGIERAMACANRILDRSDLRLQAIERRLGVTGALE